MRAASAAPVTCSTCELHAEAVFRVEGLDCHEEVVILERRLKPLVGVESLSADVMGQRLHVKYDAAKLTTSAMVDAVGQTGMRMWLEHEAPRASATDVRARQWLTSLSGLGLVLGAIGSAYPMPTVARVMFLASALGGGIFPARRAVLALRLGAIDINVLMVIAVAGALILGEWLEAASVVFLFSLAQWLEVRTLERARQAIRSLIDLAPRHALVRRGGRERATPIEEVAIGDVVLVRPGDKVPVDGLIVDGQSDVNEAPMTGESLPLDKRPGDEVYAGTINGRGALEIAVTRIGHDTRLARVIHLVEVAQSNRAPVQAFVDRFARLYTPAVIALAVLVAGVPPLFTGAAVDVWVYRALVLLVIACPCALVISTPVSIVAALSAAARNGVLIKGGTHLERLAKVQVIVFDKTGTLTKGELLVTDVVPVADLPEQDVVRLAAAVDGRSAHPVARAIAAYARERGISPPRAADYVSVPGKGARGRVADTEVVVGNEALLDAHGIARPEAIAAHRWSVERKSVVFVAAAGRVVGAIAIADRTRDTARETIELLRAQGVGRVVMLTGDHAGTARAVAEAVGIDEYESALTPDQKHDRVRRLAEGSSTVMMVGDGVNDAPALAAADVGVAIGAAASETAIETADVAVMSGELIKLPYALRLARATLRNVKTNVAVSLVLKAAFLIMALTGTATLWMAVLADTGASVIVVANALRLLRAR